MSSQPPTPGLRYCFTIRAEVDSWMEVGKSGSGTLYFIPITGGQVRGEGFEGKVLHGGGDWATMRSDKDVLEVEARYQIQLNNGVVIDIINTGLTRYAKPGTLEIEYFMTRPHFRVAHPDYDWMTKAVFVGQADSKPDATEIHIFEVVNGA